MPKPRPRGLTIYLQLVVNGSPSLRNIRWNRGILRNNGATPSNATYLGGINMLMSDHMEQMREVMGEAWL